VQAEDPTCIYDPIERLVFPCGTEGALSYDGDNVVRTSHDDDELKWSFVHSPGIDNPIMGHRQVVIENSHEYIYYVTDGRGRQLAVGEASGQDFTDTGHTSQYFGRAAHAGGVHNSFGFSAARQPSAELAGLSFFRNRWYDQRTGRWTQEDPIGLAGGVNLYQYVGNNPASYTDPFGLMPCDPPGSCQAIGATIGFGVGAVAGTVLASGCTLSSGGICAAGVPAIITTSAGLGSGVGGLSGAIVEGGSDALANIGGAVKRGGKGILEKIRGLNRPVIEVILGALGITGRETPPEPPRTDEQEEVQPEPERPVGSE